MKRILLALSALAIGTAAASAADMAPKYTKAPPPPPPPPCIWCGFYIGLNGGWAGTTGGNNSAVALTAFETGVAPTPIFIGSNTFNQNTSGGFGGGQIGYNWVFPYGGAGGYGGGPSGWLVGVEADIQGASLHRSFPTLFFTEPPDVASISADSRLDWFGTLRGRLGFATGPVLFYGTGGLAYGGVRNNLLVGFHDDDTGLNALGFSNGFNNNNNNTRWGWVAGAGIEWMFAPNWSLKGEYQYINLGSVTQTAIASVTSIDVPLVGLPFTETEGVIASRRVNMNFNTVRIGVNYHFGGPGYGGPGY
jgi:outer membrane immunogenic protein